MRLVLMIAFVCFAIGALAQKVADSSVRFLALGDSYTIGQGVNVADRWPEQFVEALKSRGISTEKLTTIAQTGWRTDNLLNAIASQNPDSDYNLVSLLIGVNNQYQGSEISLYPIEFRQLLERAVELCGGRKEGVFVLSIPDYGYTPFGLSNQARISNEIDQYNQINRNITQEMGITYYDITPISREVIAKPEYLASDMLHPSGTMYARWVQQIVSSSDFEIITTSVLEHEAGANPVVYPNPASHNVNIQATENANGVTVYNGQGVVIWQVEPGPFQNISIDISGWSTGIYYYRIGQHPNTFVSGKLVVQ